MIVALILGIICTSIFLPFVYLAGYMNDGWFIVYGVLGTFIAGLYVMVDLLMIMIPGQIDTEDYILGSLMLYVDIIRMLLYLLVILGKRK